MDTKQNGAGSAPISPAPPSDDRPDLSPGGVSDAVSGFASGLSTRPPPTPVADLAEACVRFVERALGVRLDYRPETLPLLDHYLEQARSATLERAEALPVVAQMAGAYFGEVIRRRHASWWRTDGQDPTFWQVEFESVYLAFCPVLFVREALSRVDRAAPSEAVEAVEAEPVDDRIEPEENVEGDAAALDLEEDDRVAVAARLAELPPVSDAEYYAPSTRLEVIDIAVEAIRSRRIAAGEEAEASLEPDDYGGGDD